MLKINVTLLRNSEMDQRKRNPAPASAVLILRKPHLRAGFNMTEFL